MRISKQVGRIILNPPWWSLGVAGRRVRDNAPYLK